MSHARHQIGDNPMTNQNIFSKVTVSLGVSYKKKS
jgi:hypothetical protein